VARHTGIRARINAPAIAVVAWEFGRIETDESSEQDDIQRTDGTEDGEPESRNTT